MSGPPQTVGRPRNVNDKDKVVDMVRDKSTITPGSSWYILME